MNNKYCQSCAMPLTQKNIDNRGTESDNSKSLEYCNMCYTSGKFIAPDITYEQMLDKGIKGIESSNQNKVVKWIMRKSYPGMLKKVNRWKVQ